MDLLFLSSSGALSGLVARLRQSSVSVTVADTPEMVLAATRRHTPDAVVVELLDAQSPGAKMLEDLAKMHPRIFRVGLALRENLEEIWVGGIAAQRILPWRGSVRDVIGAVEDMRRVRLRLPHAGARAMIGRLSLLPITPWALAELRALPNTVSCSDLVGLLRQDPVLACQVMRWGLNMEPSLASSFRPLHGAVELLGASTLRKALLALLWPSPMDPGFELEAHCLHAVQAAGLSADLEAHGPSEQAYVVGLLHSLGLAAMSMELSAANIGSPYDLDLASSQRRTLGFDCAQLGAAIMDLWGFPSAWASALEAAHEPSQVSYGDARLSAAVHLSSSLLAQREPDLSWLRAQGITSDISGWEILRVKSLVRAEGLRPQGAQPAPASTPKATPKAMPSRAPGKHTPASMTVLIGLAKTLVGSDPERFTATAEQLLLIPVLAPELSRDQDVFVVSAVLMALLHDLKVRSSEQRTLFRGMAKGGAPSTGTALSFSMGPAPEGRESDHALHMLRALMEERSKGTGLGAAREKVLADNPYPYGVSDALMGLPAADEADRTPLWALQEGMVVGEDVLDEEGRLLARAGQQLSKRVVNAIQRQACCDAVVVEAA